MVAFHTPISCKSTVFSMRFASLRPPVDSLDWSAGSSHRRLLTSPPLDGTTTATTIARPPARTTALRFPANGQLDRPMSDNISID